MRDRLSAWTLIMAFSVLSPVAWAQDPNASGDATKLPIDAAVEDTYKAISTR